MDALYAGKHYDAFIKKCAFNSCIISNIVFVPRSQYFHRCQRRPIQYGHCLATWYPSEDQKASTQATKAKKGSKWNWCSEKKPAHASYAAAIINALSLPVEFTPRTQQSDLKSKDWEVDRAVQSCDRKI